MKFSEIEDFVNDLRDFADFVEKHGVELPSAYFQTKPEMRLSIWYPNKEPLIQATKVLTKAGIVEKELTDYAYSVKQHWGTSIELEYWTTRDAVCTKRQVGIEQVVEKKYVETGLMVDKPVYEWDCDPLLK